MRSAGTDFQVPPSMNVRYLEAAQAEFDEAFEWYELQHPELGYEFGMNETDKPVS